MQFYYLIPIIIILLYIIYNLYNKNIKLRERVEETYTKNDELYNHILRISEVIKFSEKKLEEIDEKGSFKSDDEVGFFFISLKAIQSVLNQFKIDYDGSNPTSEDKEEKKT